MIDPICFKNRIYQLKNRGAGEISAIEPNPLASSKEAKYKKEMIIHVHPLEKVLPGSQLQKEAVKPFSLLEHQGASL